MERLIYELNGVVKILKKKQMTYHAEQEKMNKRREQMESQLRLLHRDQKLFEKRAKTIASLLRQTYKRLAERQSLTRPDWKKDALAVRNDIRQINRILYGTDKLRLLKR